MQLNVKNNYCYQAFLYEVVAYLHVKASSQLGGAGGGGGGGEICPGPKDFCRRLCVNRNCCNRALHSSCITLAPASVSIPTIIKYTKLRNVSLDSLR